MLERAGSRSYVDFVFVVTGEREDPVQHFYWKAVDSGTCANGSGRLCSQRERVEWLYERSFVTLHLEGSVQEFVRVVVSPL